MNIPGYASICPNKQDSKYPLGPTIGSLCPKFEIWRSS